MAENQIMYVCAECAIHNPEGCGHFDRNDLRVMPNGQWACEPCFDEAMRYGPQRWPDLPAPPEYVAMSPAHRGGEAS